MRAARPQKCPVSRRASRKSSAIRPSGSGGCERRRALALGIFVIRTEDGIVIRRAEKDETGNWMLKSDHPACEPEPSRGSVVIGEVRWMAKKI